MVGDRYRPDCESKPDPAPCIEPYMAKRVDGTAVLAYRPVRNPAGLSLKPVRSRDSATRTRVAAAVAAPRQR
jgi:hypothetical protein